MDLRRSFEHSFPRRFASLATAMAFTATLVPALASNTAHANSLTDASRASINASIAIPVALVAGTSQFFRDAGQLSVTAVKTVGNVSVITLRGLASGAEASVQITGKVIEGLAVVPGMVLQGIASATGVLLVFAGKALMFVPNEMGMALLHHSRARDF